MRAVAIDPRLRGPVPELAELWASERGLAPERSTRAGVALSLVLAEAEPGAGAAVPGPLRAGRDGWTLELEAAPRPDGFRAGTARTAPGGVAMPWLESGGLPLVRTGPGRIELSFAEAREVPAGDPISFAVSWSELFDRCLLPPPAVVPLAERRAAGSAEGIEPAPRPVRERAEGPALEALLAAAAAALALTGALRGGRG